MRDEGLLLGVLAVQLGFATPAQIMAAAASWSTRAEQHGLAQELEQQHVLSRAQRALLEGMLAEALAQHGGDPRRTLDSLGGPELLARSLGGSFVLAPPAVTPPGDPGAGDLAVTREQPGRYSLVAREEPGAAGTPLPAEIGRGGLGRVLLVMDEHLGRKVAMKELLAGVGTQGEALSGPQFTATARFLREARVTGQLEHPNIVPVYELGRRPDGGLYYTMKLVRGRTLGASLSLAADLQGRLGLLGHVVDLCQAVAYAHSRGVIHRDIKPDNVMLGEFGETVVLDWGLAKLRGQEDLRGAELMRGLQRLQGAGANQTVDGAALGTPAYMSPEQALGKLDAVDERSDVWSLGAVLYELLTGRPPFTGETVFEIIGKVLQHPIQPVRAICPQAPPELAAVAEKALRREPRERYQSARELAAELEAYQSGLRVGAYSYSAWELLGRFFGQHRILAIAGLVVLLAIGASSALVFRAWRQSEAALASEQRARAEAELSGLVDSQHLSQGLQEKAERLLGERDLLGAEVFAAASLVHNPANPFGRGGLAGLPAPARAAAERTRVDAHSTLQAALSRREEGHLAYLGAHRDAVYALDFSPGDAWLASTGKDGQVWVQPLREPGSPARSFDAGHGFTPCLAFSPDGALLATAGFDGQVRLWRVPTWQPAGQLQGHSRQVLAVAWAPDGRSLASAGRDQEVRLWDVERLALRRTLAGAGNILVRLAFSADGKYVLGAGNEPVVHAWETATGKHLPALRGHTDAVYGLAFSPAGDLLATASWDRDIRLWSWPSRTPAGLLRGHQGWVGQLAFSPDGKRLASASWDQTVKIWDLEERRLSATLRHGTGVVLAVAFSRSGALLASAGADRQVRLWQRTPNPLRRSLVGHTGEVRALAYRADGQRLASAGRDGTIRVWGLPAGSEALRLTGHQGGVEALAFLGPSELASAGLDRKVMVWGENGLARELGQMKGPVMCLAASHRGDLVLSGDAEGDLQLWDAQGARPPRTLTGSRGQLWSALFLPGDRRVLASGLDPRLLVWDVDRPGEPTSLGVAPSSVYALALAPDGDGLAVGVDRAVELWSLARGQRLARLEVEEGTIVQLAFSPDGRLLLSGGDDNTARLWDLSARALVQVTRLTGQVKAGAFSPDGAEVALNDSELIRLESLRLDLWKRPPLALQREAEARAGVRLEGFGLVREAGGGGAP
ncbi:MAG TPA: protein kinase [Myxococcota bacterium]|nr:protein kinase [Myxococcota bacterium]HRY93948.1 protein kinase [Myxococcota bacterium]HSA21267.1 protein kinase [Myxococcota bacterium]